MLFLHSQRLVYVDVVVGTGTQLLVFGVEDASLPGRSVLGVFSSYT